MTNLIGISGKIRSGKDTLAKMIWWAMGGNNFDDIRDYYMDDFVSNNPEKWQIKKFADKLKVGTEVMRDNAHPNIWVNSLFSSYRNPSPSEVENKVLGYSKWIITDVRFLNEVEAIKERGGIMIRIDRTSYYTDNIASHESEMALDHYSDWDFRIFNEGTLSQLYEQAKHIVKTYKLK